MVTQLLTFQDFIKKAHGDIVITIDNDSQMVSLSCTDRTNIKFFFLMSLDDFITKFPRLSHVDARQSTLIARLDDALKNDIVSDILENGVPSCVSMG